MYSGSYQSFQPSGFKCLLCVHLPCKLAFFISVQVYPQKPFPPNFSKNNPSD